MPLLGKSQNVGRPSLRARGDQPSRFRAVLYSVANKGQCPIRCEVTDRVHARPWTRDPCLLLAVIGSLLLMASSFIVAKILLQHDLPPLLLAGWRFLLAAPMALMLILISSRASLSDFIPSHFAVRDYATISVIGLLQTTAAIGLLYMAMCRVSATTAAVLMFTTPIWVVTERLVLHEEAALRGRTLGLILRVSGALLAIQVGRDGFSSPNALVGDGIGLAAASCWAAATIVHRRAGLLVGTWVLHFWQMLVGATVLIVLAYLGGEQWPSRLTPLEVGCVLWLAIPVSAVSFGLWLFALGRSGQVHTSGFLFFVPLIAAVISHLVLNTRLTGWQAVGGVLIGLAVWFESRSVPPEFVPPP